MIASTEKNRLFIFEQAALFINMRDDYGGDIGASADAIKDLYLTELAKMESITYASLAGIL